MCAQYCQGTAGCSEGSGRSWRWWNSWWNSAELLQEIRNGSYIFSLYFLHYSLQYFPHYFIPHWMLDMELFSLQRVPASVNLWPPNSQKFTWFYLVQSPKRLHQVESYGRGAVNHFLQIDHEGSKRYQRPENGTFISKSFNNTGQSLGTRPQCWI